MAGDGGGNKFGAAPAGSSWQSVTTKGKDGGTSMQLVALPGYTKNVAGKDGQNISYIKNPVSKPVAQAAPTDVGDNNVTSALPIKKLTGKRHAGFGSLLGEAETGKTLLGS